MAWMSFIRFELPETRKVPSTSVAFSLRYLPLDHHRIKGSERQGQPHLCKREEARVQTYHRATTVGTTPQTKKSPLGPGVEIVMDA